MEIKYLNSTENDKYPVLKTPTKILQVTLRLQSNVLQDARNLNFLLKKRILVNKPNIASDALILCVVMEISLKESILEIKCYEKRCGRPDIIVRHV